MAVFAATYREPDTYISSFLSFKTDYSKQLYYFIIALVIGVLILLTDSKFFTATANIWYALGILLLLLVFPFGAKVKGTESIIRFGGFQFQPAEFCKVSVCLALAKYLSLPNLDFSKTRSQLIAAAITLLPAAMSILQKETGLALVYFSFFLVMYREGLPATILVVGFSVGVLVVATLLVDQNILALAITIIATIVGYIVYNMARRKRGILFKVVAIWLICVGIQRIGVPIVFKNVMQPHQVERIYSTLGADVPEEYQRPSEKGKGPVKKGEKDVDYNV